MMYLTTLGKQGKGERGYEISVNEMPEEKQFINVGPEDVVMETISGLQPDTEYNVSVFSSASPQIFHIQVESYDITIRTLKATFPVPQGISVSAEARTARVSWAANTDGATRYHLSLEGVTTTILVSALNSGEYEFTGLTPQTTYTLVVVAQADDTHLDSLAYRETFVSRSEAVGSEQFASVAC